MMTCGGISMRVDLRHGDCVELMRAMPENSVDSIVTDPPYELSFMGKTWDGAGIAYSLDMWREAFRVLKPGGHLLAFGGTRTYHRMACAIEDAGFEIRDSIHWVYGSGFPKSLNVGKAIDKAAGVEREVTGHRIGMYKVDDAADRMTSYGDWTTGHDERGYQKIPVTAPATEEARRWEGWGTALKPAHEPVVVARKPLSGTVAGNVLVWGTGGLNIDGCRVGTDEAWRGRVLNGTPLTGYEGGDGLNAQTSSSHPSGRWPANIVLDGAAAAALDQQSGVSKSPAVGSVAVKAARLGQSSKGDEGPRVSPNGHGDSGGASRFFTQADFGPDDWPFVYQAKPSKRERNAGLDGLPEKRREGTTPQAPGRQMHGQTDRMPAANHHPTVKPVALMRHLVRLVTPPGGTVLDPFAGSGTTLVAAVLEGMHAIGCEMTDEYLPIIEGRVAWAEEQAQANPEQPTLL
jgi:DNA modification methylase